jgi:hypothetical protein
MSKLTAYYIDDESFKPDTIRYQERLSRAPDFACKLIPPPEMSALDDAISESPDLFLIDYELNQKQPTGAKVSYKGTTLAAEIRARFPDRPIVLITRESVLNLLDRQTRRQIIEKAQPCDELLYKRQLDDNLDETRQALITLVQGFKALRGIQDKNWDKLAEALQANEEESRLLREAVPPLKKNEWIVTGAANWLRNVVLEYPGILYDPIYTATRLGISLDSFFSEEVQQLVAPARYNGIFAPSEGRWWKSRLFRLAKPFILEQDISGPQNRAFAEAFYKKSGKQLTPANCVWDHTPIADWVCFVMKQPVKIKHSLRYYPDSRPSVMDDARVSFYAIRRSTEFDEKLLDSEGLSLLKQIESLPEP